MGKLRCLLCASPCLSVPGAMAAIWFMLPLYRVSKSGNKIFHIIGISHENFPKLHLTEYDQEKKIYIIKIHFNFLHADSFINNNQQECNSSNHFEFIRINWWFYILILLSNTKIVFIFAVQRYNTKITIVYHFIL